MEIRTNPTQEPETGRDRVIIEGVTPQINCGRYPIKRTIGEKVIVEADIFTDGHDAISCLLLYRQDHVAEWTQVPMEFLINDRWRGEFTVKELGRYRYCLQGWIDRFRSWQRDLRKRVEAGQDVTTDLLIGAELVKEAAERASGEDMKQLKALADSLRENRLLSAGTHLAMVEDLAQLGSELSR